MQLMTTLVLTREPRPATRPPRKPKRTLDTTSKLCVRPATSSGEKRPAAEEPKAKRPDLGEPKGLAQIGGSHYFDEKRVEEIKEKRAPPQLTHRQVPCGRDYLGPYCSACQFSDCERCTYCIASKLTKVRRLNLERFAKIALSFQPHLKPLELVELASKYAKSDDFASEFNYRVGWRAPESKFCLEHQVIVDDNTEQLLNAQKTIADLRRDLDHEKRERDRLATRISELVLTTSSCKMGNITKEMRLRAIVDAKHKLEDDMLKIKTNYDKLASAVANSSNASLLELVDRRSTSVAVQAVTDSKDAAVQHVDDYADLKAQLADLDAENDQLIAALKQKQGNNNALRRRVTSLSKSKTGLLPGLGPDDLALLTQSDDDDDTDDEDLVFEDRGCQTDDHVSSQEREF